MSEHVSESSVLNCNKDSNLSSGNAAYLWKKFIAAIYNIKVKK